MICHGQPQEGRESERRCNLISSHLVSLFQTKYPNNLTHLTFDAVVPRHLKGLYRSYAPDFFSTNIFSSGSLKERAVYKRAGHQASDATNEQAQPQNLKLSIRPITPIFGTDFDVIVEVRVQNEGMHAENQHFYFHHNFIFDFIFLAGKCRVRQERWSHRFPFAGEKWRRPRRLRSANCPHPCCNVQFSTPGGVPETDSQRYRACSLRSDVITWHGENNRKGQTSVLFCFCCCCVTLCIWPFSSQGSSPSALRGLRPMCLWPPPHSSESFARGCRGERTHDDSG